MAKLYSRAVKDGTLFLPSRKPGGFEGLDKSGSDPV